MYKIIDNIELNVDSLRHHPCRQPSSSFSSNHYASSTRATKQIQRLYSTFPDLVGNDVLNDHIHTPNVSFSCNKIKSSKTFSVPFRPVVCLFVCLFHTMDNIISFAVALWLGLISLGSIPSRTNSLRAD